ncbi:hypothetical protein M5K25_002091 [Dendrobium thyrsiflorum]|uniref:Uncharacterized protein n=1 Tax=Dendrobium thyrsiflorum TaxID=117978 RepID=A0ABD0VRT4_DENTH
MEPQRQEKLVKSDSTPRSLGKTPVKMWKPVSRHGNGNLVQNDHGDVKQGVPATKDAERLLSEGSCLAFEGIVSDFERCRGSMMFSSEAAKAFLVQTSSSNLFKPSLVIDSHREGAEVFQGDEICRKKSIELLEELCLPKDLFPLEDIEEFGFNRTFGFIWLIQKKKKDHLKASLAAPMAGTSSWCSEEKVFLLQFPVLFFLPIYLNAGKWLLMASSCES